MPNPRFSDLEICREALKLVDAHVALLKREVNTKLADLQTMDADACMTEFGQLLDDHISDTLGDTLEYWRQDLVSEIECETGRPLLVVE